MNSKPINFLIILFFGLALNSYAQIYDFNEEVGFYNYLSEKKYYFKQITLLENIDQGSLSYQTTTDSYNYFFGLVYHNLGNTKQAIKYFSVISSFKHLNKGIYIYVHDLLKEGENSRAESILNNRVETGTNEHLKRHYLNGIYLLNRDLERLQLTSYLFSHQQYGENFQKQGKIYSEILNHKTKSPLLAGTLSMMLPGMGKIYNGQLKSGLATLLTNSILALQAFEAYDKKGINDPYCIFFGGLFSIFYLGNIYGSMISVKVSERSFNERIDRNILLDLRIALHQ